MNQSEKICYLDNNATTRVAPEVVEAMTPYFTENWGNPSAAYKFGNELGKDLDRAREQVAALINAEPREIIFTSCGTESNNAAIHSALFTQPEKRHIVTTQVEHAANIAYSEQLRKQGYEVTLLPVEPDGSIDLHLLELAIRPDTAIVSMMWANNETGVLFPIYEAAAICRSKGVLFHTDAVQAAGKVDIDVKLTEVSMLSISGHKLNAPKGVGALFVKRRTPYESFITGGGQERGRRGGTYNVPYIVGLGKAAEMALIHLTRDVHRVRTLRDRLEEGILERIKVSCRNGSQDLRLPNTCNVCFHGVEAEAVLMLLDKAGICASSGSACKTGSIEPSHVLTAMGLRPSLARGAVRFSFGVYNTEEDVDCVLEALPPIIDKLRAVTLETDSEPIEKIESADSAVVSA